MPYVIASILLWCAGMVFLYCLLSVSKFADAQAEKLWREHLQQKHFSVRAGQ